MSLLRLRSARLVLKFCPNRLVPGYEAQGTSVLLLLALASTARAAPSTCQYQTFCCVVTTQNSKGFCAASLKSERNLLAILLSSFQAEVRVWNMDRTDVQVNRECGVVSSHHTQPSRTTTQEGSAQPPPHVFHTQSFAFLQSIC